MDRKTLTSCRSKLFCLFLFAFISMQLSAANYYVSTSGNDANAGTESQPWRTIQKAASTLVAGDTVYIKAGSYAERVMPQHSGTAGNDITYTANPGEVVTVNGSGIPVPEDEGLFHIHGKSYIKVSGLRVINSAQAGIYVEASSTHITIQGNYTNNTGSSGIGVWNSSNIIIDGNEVESSCSNGLQENITVAGTSSFEVKNNHVHNELPGYGKEGICIKDGSANGKVYANHVHHTWKVGIYVDAWDKHTHDIDVFQNIVHDSRNSGIVVASEMGGLLENVRIYNNVSYNNGLLGISVSRNGPASTLVQPLRKIEVINNTVYNNGLSGWGGGIDVGNRDAQEITFRNNICSQNLSFQIVVPVQQVGVVTVDHNLIDGFREYVDKEASEILGNNHVTGNPMLMNPSVGDFRLQGSSPAIDSGSSLKAPINDFEGSLRPYGSGVDIGAFEYGASAVPAIKANNSDGPVTIRTTDTLSLTVSLDPRNSSGNNADWWLAADTPAGWYYYTFPGVWNYAADITGFKPAYQGPLFNLLPIVVMNTSGLPEGAYRMYFGIDTNANGVIDFHRLYHDSVVVSVIP